MSNTKESTYCAQIREKYDNLVKQLDNSEEGIRGRAKEQYMYSISLIGIVVWGIFAAVVMPMVAEPNFFSYIVSVVVFYYIFLFIFNYKVEKFVKNEMDYNKNVATNYQAVVNQWADKAVMRYRTEVSEYVKLYTVSPNTPKLAELIYGKLRYITNSEAMSFTINKDSVSIAHSKIDLGSRGWNELPNREACCGLAFACGQLILIQLRMDYPERKYDMNYDDATISFHVEKPQQKAKQDFY